MGSKLGPKTVFMFTHIDSNFFFVFLLLVVTLASCFLVILVLLGPNQTILGGKVRSKNCHDVSYK